MAYGRAQLEAMTQAKSEPVPAPQDKPVKTKNNRNKKSNKYRKSPGSSPAANDHRKASLQQTQDQLMSIPLIATLDPPAQHQAQGTNTLTATKAPPPSANDQQRNRHNSYSSGSHAQQQSGRNRKRINKRRRSTSNDRNQTAAESPSATAIQEDKSTIARAKSSTPAKQEAAPSTRSYVSYADIVKQSLVKAEQSKEQQTVPTQKATPKYSKQQLEAYCKMDLFVFGIAEHRKIVEAILSMRCKSDEYESVIV
ncbi:hypothetical protein MP638_003049 [Amoeboaphelidium occidentale]|nr:hypothetical protein MP638_003049 [Amoeboaphelidium occidentale]